MYSAYRALEQPYANLLKSAALDDNKTFATTASIILGRKGLDVGVGFDPGDLEETLKSDREERTADKILRATGRFLAHHKYKLVGATVGGAVMAMYRTGRVSLELGNAARIVETHCGIASSVPDAVKKNMTETTVNSAHVAHDRVERARVILDAAKSWLKQEK